MEFLSAPIAKNNYKKRIIKSLKRKKERKEGRKEGRGLKMMKGVLLGSIAFSFILIYFCGGNDFIINGFLFVIHSIFYLIEENTKTRIEKLK